MNIDNFNTFLSRNSISQENWKIYYNFSNITGGLIVLNELYPPETQFSGACVYVSNNPGLIVGINTGGFSYDGSGYFSGDSIVRLNKNIDAEDWTIFLTYRNSGCQIDRDKSTILFSNQTNISDRSGLSFGFNGANKFFLEYNDGIQKNIYTSKYEGKNNTCFSLAKNKNDFELSIHDILNSRHTLESFKLNDYINSNIYYLGNAYNITNYYTGFKGYMDDFIYLSGFVGFNQRKNLGAAIFTTGIIPAYTVKIISGFNKISTSFITTGEIIGTGITGYQEVPIALIPRKNGTFIQVCEQSGLLGPIYGEQIIFQTGSETGQRIINVIIPEDIKYDLIRLKGYTNNHIKLLYTIDSLDFIEIDTYTGFLNNYKFINEYDNNLQQFLLDLNFTGQSINLFNNGILQLSGSNINGQVVTGNYSLSGRYIDSDLNFDQFTDKLTYFNLFSSPEVINYTGSSIYALVNNLNNSFYYNGQKLISGYNYVINGANVSFSNINDTGKIIVSTYLDKNYNLYTGYFKTLTGQILDLSNEQVYLNGVLQINDQDYIKTNCQSLLNSLFYPTQKLYNYYNNDENSFNLL